MSEVAESTAAAPAEAAAVVEAPVQTEAAQPTTAATENLSPRERARARGREIDRARTESERKAEQAREQARQGDGKFAKETDAAEPAAEAVAGEAPEVSESESPQAEATAQESDGGPAEGFERVQYPEGHPLRDQGVEYEDVPTALAPKFKALLNGTYARRQEVEQAQARALELEQRLLRMEAEARFQQEHGSEFWTAQDQEIYDALLEDERGGQTAAEAYKRGRQQEAESKLQAVREEADLQALSRQWQHNGKQFREEAHQSLPRLIPGLRAEEIDTAIGMYRAELEQVESMAWQQAQAAGIPRAQFARQFAQKVGYSGDDFFAVTKAYLESRPGVIARRQEASQSSEVERNRIKAEVEEAERQRRIEASKRHATNPNRNLGGVSAGPTTTAPEPESLVGKSVTEIKKSAKERIRERARSMFPGS